MNQFLEWVSKLFGSWKPWIVVPPWDIGVRVRLGRRAVALGPGPHWRIPFVDDVTLVNTRVRVATTPPITIQGEEGKCRTKSAVIGYVILDPLLAMMRFEHPSVAVQGYAQALVASGVSAEECEKQLSLQLSASGVAIEFAHYCEDVECQSIRVLQNSYGIYSDNQGPQDGRAGTRY